MKSKLILCLTLVLSGILSAYGLCAELPVTPNSLSQGNYIFSISTNRVENGIFFHVTIASKADPIPPESSAGLCVVTHWEPGGGQIVPAKPAINVVLKKNSHNWTADFTVPNELLKSPDLCFVFSVPDFWITKDGKRIIPATSFTFFEIKLRDFLKP